MNTALSGHLARFCYLIALFLSPTIAEGQTIATALPGCLDAGITQVGIGCGGGTTIFGLSGGQFQVGNVDGSVCCGSGGDGNSYFQFSPVNIAGYASVAINLSYAAAATAYEEVPGGPFFGCSGNPTIDNGHDQIVFAYSLDGGPFVNSLYVTGTTAADFTGTWTEGSISGSSLVIRVYASNKATAEIFTFSNLLVTGTPVVVSAGPDLQVCGAAPVALSGSGTGTWSGGTGTFSNPNAPNTTYTPGPGDIGQKVTLTFRGIAPAAGCGPALPAPEDQMSLTVTARPAITGPGNLSACSSITLPTISGSNLGSNAAYFTGPNGTGTRIAEGTALTSGGTLFIFSGNTGCSDEKSINLQIQPLPSINPLGNLSGCGSIFLPSITGTNVSGAAYYTGPNGGGQRYEQGNLLNFSTRLYAYSGTPGCSDEQSFEVSIDPQPDILPIAAVNACERYTLPAIAGSSLSGSQRYFSATGGSGQTFNPGQVITSGITLYAFDGKAGCSDEEPLQINILPRPQLNPLPDISGCGSVLLPPITGAVPGPSPAFFTGPNGSGIRLAPGTSINTSGLYYAFSSTMSSCSAEEPLRVTVLPQPQLEAIPDREVCNAFPLPVIRGTGLSGNQAYYTGPNGSGIRLTMDTLLRSSGTLYVLDSVNSCKSERSFLLTIVPQPVITPLPDTAVCGFFVLPPLTGSALSGREAYYTGPKGSGLRRMRGDTLFSSILLFAYDSIANCSTQDTFSVTIRPTPRLAPLMDTLLACVSYTLPDISGSGLSGGQAYYSGSGGTGTRFPAGSQIRDTIRLFVYDAIGVCSAERSFTLLPVPPVQLDSIPNITACASYTLPDITGTQLTGNEGFYTGPQGTGQRFAPGDILTRSGRFYAFGGLVQGCKAERAFTITITEGPEPVLTVNTPISCFGDRSGAIRLTVSKGLPPYTIQWGDGIRDSLVRRALPSGAYLVTVSDNGGCSATTSLELKEPPLLVLSCNAVRPTGKINGTDGAAEIRISGGTERYAYQVSGATGVSGSGLQAGSHPIQGLGPGNYQVSAQDQLGCRQTCDFFIAEPVCSLKVALEAIPPRCALASDGRINTRIIDGTGPYTFDWNFNHLDGVQNPANLPAGTYQLTLTDSVGCTANAQLTLADPLPLSLDCAPAAPVSKVKGSDGKVPFSLRGGTPGYTLSWQGKTSGSFPLSQAGDTLVNGLPSGSYRLLAQDRNGCVDSCSFRIDEPICTLKVQALELQPIACNGDQNGAIHAAVNGGTAPFSYSWSVAGPASGRDTLSNLPSGIYRITATDAIGCQDSSSIELKSPPPLLAQCTSINGERTRGGDEGKALLRFSGGTGAIGVSWPQGFSGRTEKATIDSLLIAGLRSGIYSPEFTDQNGCKTACNFIIDSIDCKLRASAAIGHVSCFGARDGQIAVSLQEEQGQVFFTWSNGASGEGLHTLSALPAGHYRITITDMLNCKDTIEAEVKTPSPIEFSCRILRNVSEFGLNDGAVRFSAAGGTAPYRFIVSGRRDTIFTLSEPGSKELQQLYAGNYLVIIQDANGCVDTCSFEVTQPPCRISVTLSGEPPACAMTPTATIASNLSNARAPFIYRWNIAALDGKSGGSSLRAGSYALTVTDSVGCSASAQLQIADPPVLRLECRMPFPTKRINGKDGGIAVVLQGGILPYRLSLSGDVSRTYEIAAPGTFTIDNLSRGEYSIALEDSNGCIAEPCSFTIEDPVCDLETRLTGKHPGCTGFSDGSISVQISNGVEPVKLHWDRDGFPQQRPDSLKAGTYTLIAIDDRLCSDTAQIVLQDPPRLLLQCSVIEIPRTVGGKEGVAQLITSGGTGKRTYLWNGAETFSQVVPDTLTLRNLPAGNYSVQVTDSNNCSTECSFLIPAVICSLSVAAKSTPARCFGDTSGSVILDITGARGNPAFLWSNGARSKHLAQVPAGTYRVTVTDEALCKDSIAVNVNNPFPVQISSEIIRGVSGIGKQDALYRLEYSGGTPPYTIVWTGPSGGQIIRSAAGRDTLSSLLPGSYTAIVTDSLGCTASQVFRIDTFVCRLNAALDYLPLGCETASVRTTISGVTGALNLDWNRNEYDGQTDLPVVPAGIYTLRVSDASGCSVEKTIEVKTSGPMRAAVEAIDGDCPGDPGRIVIEYIQGGRPPYSFKVNDEDPRQAGIVPITLRNMRPGAFRIALQSSDGCKFDTLLSIHAAKKPLLELGPDLEILRGDSIELQPVIGFDPETVRWTPAASLSSSDRLVVVASPEITTTYLLEVTDERGCPVDDRISIIVRDRAPVFFPNAFSPNGDGINDYFTGFGGELVETIEQLSIFDRWGELLFYTEKIPFNTPQSGWDGRVRNGNPAPSGAYVFRAVVQLKRGQTLEFAGEVLLVR